MRLLSLTIDGFKSFAHKTTINFQPGMTGIIGPNGSGKSNIIEAIRWVMGEQSAKSLRGGKMADVIFNGSKDHHPLNRALVKITLDNSDHYLPSDYSEITICRKLYRNGDSEYLVNDHQVRLRDIVNLFVDSGIGRESFSIISQGRVAAIFNGSPADRRAVIENVAGVAKYKHNKQSAQKRLEETHANLNRVNDIIAGLKDRLEPLEEQSALAQDYLEQKGKLDLLDRTQTVRMILARRQELDQASHEQDQAQKLADQYKERLLQTRQQVAKLQGLTSTNSSSKDQLQATINQQVSQIAELKNQQSMAQMRSEQRSQELDRLQQQSKSVHQQLAELDDQLTGTQSAVQKHQEAYKQQQQQLSDLQSLSVAEQAAKLRQKLPQLQGKQMDLLQEITSVHNQQTFLKQAHERSLHQVQHGKDELAAAQQQAERAHSQLLSQTKQWQTVKAQLAAITDKAAVEQNHVNQLNEQYGQQQKEWYQALGNAQSTQRQLQAYRSMMEDYTGYYAGVSAVLKQRQQFPGLYGAVSELINVPDQYTVALETVLGSQLQQLVVADQSTAKQIISSLVRRRAGRATILPLDHLRPGYQPRTLGQVSGLTGFIGRAADLIDYDRKFQLVIDHLLSNTVIADNLDHATAIANAGRHQLRVVTLDGQLINASGAMTGGANRNQRIGLLSRKQQESRLKAQVNQQQTDARQLEEQVKRTKDALSASQEQLDNLQKQIQEMRQQAVQAQTDYQLAQKADHQASQQVQALSYASQQQTDQHDQYVEEQASNNAKAQKLQAQLDETKQLIEKSQAELHELEQNHSNQQEKTHQLEQKMAVERERLHTAQDNLSRFQEQQKQLQHELSALKVKQQELQGQDRQADPKRLERSLQAAQDKLKNAQQGVDQANQRQAELDDQLQEATANNERTQSLQTAALNDLANIRSKRSQLAVQVDNGLNRLSERYQMTLEEAQNNLSDLPQDELQRQLKLIHRGLADLGDVNLGAIDEYKEVSARYDFLTGQQADLLAARDQLHQTMNKMDSEVKRRFLDTFNDVSASFAETFTQIFAGGQAKLILTDPNDLLTTGIDIMAQPPGKKNQQLSLLSGGEKALTAIALLFAILKVRPVPFAILDEPEAALDDVNVDRFANYLDRFGSRGPQFIVITHRKGTMRNADVLYGVTMQESGISRVVSVDVKKSLQQDED